MPRFKQYEVTDHISVENFNLLTDYVEALANLRVTGGQFKIDRGGAALSIDKGSGTTVHWCKLTTNCPPAGGPADGGVNNAAGYILASKSGILGGALDPQTPETIRINNRDKNFSAKAGDTILVIRVKHDTVWEWQPVNPRSIVIDDDPNFTLPGFPVGVSQCPCDDCHKGLTLVDGTVCCKSSTTWEFITPWYTDPENEDAHTLVKLTYAGDDVWKSAEFDGPRCDDTNTQNVYQWKLSVSGTVGASILALQIVTDAGCPKTCLSYKTPGYWQCQCTNTLEITMDWGNTLGDDYQKAPNCYVCVTPVPTTIEFTFPDPHPVLLCNVTADPPTIWMADWADFAGQMCRGVCTPPFFFKYTGTVETGIASLGAVDINWDINILKGYPLIQSGSFASWSTGLVSLGTLYGDGSFGGNPGTFLANGVVGFAATCSGGGFDGLGPGTLSLTASIAQVGYVGFTNFHSCNDPPFGSAPVLSYHLDIPFDHAYEVPCILAQSHILVNDWFGSAGHTYNSVYDACQNVGQFFCDACDVGFDPDFDTPIFIPGTITMHPFGGGPPDCPPPPLSNIPADPPPSGSGSCASCTPPTGTADADDGSCCIGGQCLPYVSTALCTSFGGTNYGNQDLCEDACDASACCYHNSSGFITCLDSLTAESCGDLTFGAFFPGLSCATVGCGIGVLGACCYDGTCVDDVPSAICAETGNLFTAYFPCAAVDCPVTTGACCNTTTGACTVTTEAACTGFFGGVGSDCSGTPCGCCCYSTHYPSNTCSGGAECVKAVMTHTECTSRNGQFSAGAGCGLVVCNCGPGFCRIPG